MRRRSVVLLSLASLVAGCRSCSSSSSGIDSAPVVFDAAPPTDVDIKKWPSATGAGTDIGDALPTNDAVGDPKRRWALVCQGDNLAQSTW
ncbi:MAG TPA: hypothetical protein VF407_21195, partial [Polyangiaceae bacterium]